MPAMNTLDTNEGITQEGGDMDIYVFMTSALKGETTIYPMVQTSIFLNEEEERGYWKSLITHKVENNVLAIPQGSYRHRFMEEMVLNKGRHFRAVSYTTRDLNELNYRSIAARVNLAYSTAERATFIQVVDKKHKYFSRDLVIKGFGGSALGLSLKYSKKLMKRTQEILRSSHMTAFFPRREDTIWTTTGGLKLLAELLEMDRCDLFQDNKLVVAEFIRPEDIVALLGDDAKLLYDGVNMVDMELAIRCLEEQMVVALPKYKGAIRRAIREMREAAEDGVPIVGRYIFRLLGAKGLLKGDCLAVVGLKERTGADVIFDRENLKDEIWTLGGETIICMDVHEAIHDAVKWDSQSTTNFKYGLSREQQADDILSIQTAMEEVIEGKEIPKWMILSPEVHTDMEGYLVPTNKEFAFQDFHRIQGYGIDPLGIQNYGSVWLGGTKRRMSTFFNKKTGFNKKPFIPMSHAVNMGVMTYRAVEDMACVDLSHLDQSKVNYMANVGALYPTDRWLATIDLHGGQDLDDTNNIHDRLVYCDDAVHLANLVTDGVIGAEVDVPTTPEDARGLVLVIRQPNGAGEYSIEEPAYPVVRPDTPVLNLAKMPRGITYLRTVANQVEILTDPDVVYGGDYTVATAQYVLDAQANNPGIGSVANMLMVWHDAMGSVLPVGIPALEDMVDTVQQTHDQVGIEQVRSVPAVIGQQLAERLAADPKRGTDRLLVTERLKYTEGEFMEIIRERMTIHRPTDVNQTYQKAVKAISELIKDRLLQMRAESNLYKRVVNMRFSPDQMSFAKAHVEDMRDQFDAISKHYETSPYDNPFKKVANRMNLQAALREVVEAKVTVLKSDPDQMKYRIVAMYKYIIQDQIWRGKRWALGTYDQVLFRSAGADEALFDLFGRVVRDFKLTELK